MIYVHDIASGQRRVIANHGEVLFGLASDPSVTVRAAVAMNEAAGEDVDAITSAHDALEQAAHALSKALYEASATAQRGGPAPEAGAAPGGKGPDDTIDAEFEVKG